MIIFKIVYENQRPVLKTLEEIYGPIDVEEPEPDPEDDPQFRFYKRLMEERPRG